MHIIGVEDKKLPLKTYHVGIVDSYPAVSMQRISDQDGSIPVAETEAYKVYQVTWTVLNGVHGEGLLLQPKTTSRASIIAIPDADQTPEQLVGLAKGIASESQFARHLC